MKFKIKKSNIDGIGLFTIKFIPKHTRIAWFYNPYILRYPNHSRNPNMIFIKTKKGLFMYSLSDININDELTMDYRDSLNPFRNMYEFNL